MIADLTFPVQTASPPVMGSACDCFWCQDLPEYQRMPRTFHRHDHAINSIYRFLDTRGLPIVPEFRSQWKKLAEQVRAHHEAREAAQTFASDARWELTAGPWGGGV